MTRTTIYKTTNAQHTLGAYSIRCAGTPFIITLSVQ
jgi:hypothetical protein